MAGFQVILYGRFWVTPEEHLAVNFQKDECRSANRLRTDLSMVVGFVAVLM